VPVADATVGGCLGIGWRDERGWSMMTKEQVGAAASSLRQQIEIFGREAASLTSLWRAVGRPRGHDPKAWALLAEPLIAGYARYLAGLDSDSNGPVVWPWDGDDGEPWRLGDLMARGDIARIYADYLDAILDDAPSLRRGC
jgi:hypothetical protein